MSAADMTSFDEAYVLPDPRAYFAQLGPYEYQAPHHAQQVFRDLLAELPPGERVMLDLCCSYGINAALVNHDVTLDELYERYTGPKAAELSTPELIEWDREFYAGRRLPEAAGSIGVDISRPAVGYALAVGLLDEGYCENLETGDPDTELSRAAAGAGLITVTGGVAFLTERTFGRLLSAVARPVPVAAFVLRTVDFRAVTACLESHGLAVERSTDTYPQRRFTDPGEQRRAVEAVTALGEDPTGKEGDGWYHNRLHLARA
ncbi:hypothetical protein [Streptomyces sp. G-G2]|uniref:hypothetical protein n=1 Tax=Streptomyces sp. G-G2 TaxID=3046201 RepID=UPI0024B9D570|nr:hypothetical protein [Streptomyces sp. G-G2]MDJ0382723.1 hypothetical protein [Streptomyces sp. G-G2]